MTVDGISLKNVGIIRKIEISKNMDYHSVCNIEILLLNRDRAIEELQKMVGKEIEIQGPTGILMCGQIKTIKGNLAFPDSIAVIEAMSHSNKLDDAKQNRVFQNTKKTYEEIMDILSTKDVKVKIVDDGFASRVEEKVLVQKEETNFSFAVKVAKACGYHVFVNDIDERCAVHIGEFGIRKYQEINSSEILSVNYCISAKEKILEIKTRKFGQFGSYFTLIKEDAWEDDKEDFVIIGMKILYENGEITYSYRLLQEVSEEKKGNSETYFVGIAKIIENKDPEHLGRIQVEFEEFEDSMPDNRIWVNYIPLLTERDRGMVFLPDIDEFVHVFVENGKCFADGCVRRFALNEKQRNINERSICVRDKAFIINNDVISISNDEMDIDIRKDTITVGGSDSKIELHNNNEPAVLLKAKSNISIGAKAVSLSAKDSMILKANKINAKR